MKRLSNTSFRFLQNQYIKVSARKPYMTAMVTGSMMLTVSDLTAQGISARYISNYKIDARRTIGFCVFGTLYYGLVSKRIYFLYEAMFGPGRALFKSTLDSFVHTPLLLLPSFYIITGVVKGQNAVQIAEQLKSEWWTSSTASTLYWFPLMLINFRYCTPETRILFITAFSFLHKTTLSWYSNRMRVLQQTPELEAPTGKGRTEEEINTPSLLCETYSSGNLRCPYPVHGSFNLLK